MRPRSKPGRSGSRAGARRRAAAKVSPSRDARGAQAVENKWIYGRHAVRAALRNPARRHHRLIALTADAVPAEALPAGLDVEILPREAFATLLPAAAVHQGIALLADPPLGPTLGDLLRAPARDALLVVLDQVTDPRNLGAVLRAAAAFGVTAVLIQARHAPALTGVVAKAASGGLEQVPVLRVTNIARSLQEIGAAGFWRLALAGAAARRIEAARPDGGWGPTALVLGAEGRGLRPLVAKACDEEVRIAIADGPVDSLNVASAAAVALYELRRPRL